MKHYRQRPNECSLAVACMLTDQDYPVIARACQEKFGSSWGHVIDYTTFNALISWLEEQTGFSAEVSRTTFVSDTRVVVGDELPRTGRGSITVDWRVGAHVVAYEDGLVYDSAKLKPIPFKEWKAMLDAAGGRITKITPYERSTDAVHER